MKEIVFRPLGRQSIFRIIDQMIGKINLNLLKRDILVELGEDAKELLMKQGHKVEYGARSMDRTVNALVQEPIGRMILSGELPDGSHVHLGAAVGAIQFKVA